MKGTLYTRENFVQIPAYKMLIRVRPYEFKKKKQIN